MGKIVILYIGIVSSLFKCLLALIINEFAVVLVQVGGSATIPLV